MIFCVTSPSTKRLKTYGFFNRFVEGEVTQNIAKTHIFELRHLRQNEQKNKTMQNLEGIEHVKNMTKIRFFCFF